MTDPLDAVPASSRRLVNKVAATYTTPHQIAAADQLLAVGRKETGALVKVLLIGRRDGSAAGTANMILHYLRDQPTSLALAIAVTALIELAEVREAVADGVAAAQAKGDQP